MSVGYDLERAITLHAETHSDEGSVSRNDGQARPVSPTGISVAP